MGPTLSLEGFVVRVPLIGSEPGTTCTRKDVVPLPFGVGCKGRIGFHDARPGTTGNAVH